MKNFMLVISCIVILLVTAIGLGQVIAREHKYQSVLIEGKSQGYYLFVFDHEKEVWNRATKEDLRVAHCQDLRMFPAHPMMTAKEE